MGVPDPSLLAIVLDDPVAPTILAWWKAKRPGRSMAPVDGAPPRARDRLDQDSREEICRVLQLSWLVVELTLERCELAGLFDAPDGGISPVADKWLATHVARQLGAHTPIRTPRKSPPPKKKRRRSR